MKNIVLSLLLCTTIMFSCSVVKNPSASDNFKRVKYNSHLKLAKNSIQSPALQSENSKFEKPSKSIPSFTELDEIKIESVVDKKDKIISTIKNKAIASTNSNNNLVDIQITELNEKVKQLSKDFQINVENSTVADSWWDIDPEDWTLEQILLAAIAVLLVILAVYLLIELLGAVVGSILGLIILLLLAYLLIQYLS